MTMRFLACVSLFFSAAALIPGGAFAAPEPASEIDSLRKALDAQRADIDSLQKSLEAQQQLLNEQVKLLAGLQRLQPAGALVASAGTAPATAGDGTVAAGSLAQGEQQPVAPSGAAGPVTSEPKLTDLDETSALQAQLQRLESQLRDVPEDPMSALGNQPFNGAWRLPGTNASLRIGGFAKMSIVDSFDPMVSTDRFIVGSIPPKGEILPEAEKGTALTANQSRVNLDLRDNTPLGPVRAFVEGDFAGDDGTFRMRHAFGQYSWMLAGQSWSTLMDLNSSPEELNFEGVNGRINVRQPQLRFFPKIGQELNLNVALEDPQPSVSGGSGVSSFPDLVMGLNRGAFDFLGWLKNRDGWNARAAVIVRQIRAKADNSGNSAKTTGWGVTASGGVPMGWWTEKDRLFWQLTYGKGVGRYINDLGSVGGQDAIFSPSGDLKALPVFAGYLSYQHWWAPRWRSNMTFSWVDVNTYDFQSQPEYIDEFGHPYARTLAVLTNLIYNPISRVELGGELIWGERKNADHTKGSATQLQFSVRYRY